MLEANHITVNYGQREAVKDVSVSLSGGEVLAVIGPNGAGKSTLLGVLNGRIAPSSGQVLLNGNPLSTYARRVVARHIAVVAQEAELRFPVTVMEFVIGGRYAFASAWGWESEHDVKIAEMILNETELRGFESRLMTELSGGERQRAVLGRALATEARVLLLDEPTANLDLAHQATMLRLVRDRCNQRQTAAAVVTHDVNLAAQFADRVLLMKHGRQIALGPCREILTPELLRAVFDVQILVDAHPVTGAPRITPVHVMADKL